MNRLLLFLLLLPVSLSAQNNPETRLQSVDEYAKRLMSEWNIPGMGIAIVHKDRVIYAKGFGYRDLEKKLPATEKTVFPIASNSKLFTSVLAAQLAVEGKLSLDKPAKNYLPELNFYNDELNARVTLRDMLSHRTGLPTYDGIWMTAPFSRSEAISKIAFMKPSLGFREGYIYNNMMYTAAGAVIEKVTGKSWEENVTERIFKPLNMNSSGFHGVGARPEAHSQSYFKNESGELTARAYSSQSLTLGPAGTIYSTMEDMGNWLIALVNSGKFNGKQVLSAEAINETAIPNNISGKRAAYEELSNTIYALGRIHTSYKGTKLIYHTGSIDGFYSNLTYIPKDSIAIFAVHNSGPGSLLRNVINLPIVDIFQDREQTNWSKRYYDDYLVTESRNKKNVDSINASRVKNTFPSHAMSAYVGTYRHPVYGEIKIEPKGNAIQLTYRSLVTMLDHWHYDQFITVDQGKGFPDMKINFITNDKGEIDRFSTRPFGDPVVEFIK